MLLCAFSISSYHHLTAFNISKNSLILRSKTLDSLEVAHETHFHFHYHYHFHRGKFNTDNLGLYFALLMVIARSETDNMSNDNHDMDEEMEEGGQMSVAWAGMNLREQIRGKFLYRSSCPQYR